MQTGLAGFIEGTAIGDEAETILRSCVHCGFCNATCPTYQLLGDELDGPRGRIYLIKQALEGHEITQRTQLHLDRCLSCRACETACPSGVHYGRLADIGRTVVEAQVGRGLLDRFQRRLLRWIIPHPARFRPLAAAAQWVRPLLPRRQRNKIPLMRTASSRPESLHTRRMLVLEGCVQSVLAPTINDSAVRVLDRLGISLVSASGCGCCGALSHHLSAHDEALGWMRRNIDAWWPHIEQGVEAIVMTASGCGATVREYRDLLQHDPAYAAKAARVSDLTRDIGEVLLQEDCSALRVRSGMRIAFHSPCTLQHGQQLGGTVEGLLSQLGFELTPVADGHSCCGSAGTYSILQPEISQRLLTKKLADLAADEASCIATANIGCLLHLQSGTERPVCHWIELLARSVANSL